VWRQWWMLNVDASRHVYSAYTLVFIFFFIRGACDQFLGLFTENNVGGGWGKCDKPLKQINEQLCVCFWLTLLWGKK